MTRTEFNEKVKLLMKRISSSESSPIELTKSDKEILIYSFYFAVRYGDQRKWAHELSRKVSEAENCFKRKGEPDYKREKALREAANIMGWANKKKGQQPKRHPDKERAIIGFYRMLRTFFPKITKRDAIKQVYKELGLDNEKIENKKLREDAREAEFASREKYIKRLSKKYPVGTTEEEANSLAPDPDILFEDLDMMINDLITD